jgi:hypothetical protein
VALLLAVAVLLVVRPWQLPEPAAVEPVFAH